MLKSLLGPKGFKRNPSFLEKLKEAPSLNLLITKLIAPIDFGSHCPPTS